MRRFTNDHRNEEGSELMNARRKGEGAPLRPSFEGVANSRTYSRRQMLGLAGGTIAASALSFVIPKPAQAWWNTGCLRIYNYTSYAYLHVVDQEDSRYKLIIPQDESRNFNGVIFPWCDNIDEVYSKAFLFRSGSSPYPRLFYMFQNYRDDTVYWLPANASNYGQRIYAGTPPSSYLNVKVEQLESGGSDGSVKNLGIQVRTYR